MSNYGLLNNPYKHINRYRKVISIWAKYGFEDIFANSPLKNLLNESYKEGTFLNSVLNSTRWERVRMALEELGPAYVKLGQILSNRPDILPDDLLKELAKLQDLVPPFNGEEALGIIEKELKQPLNQVFTSINSTPLASASIAQVHVAHINNHQKVVVKVQRPNIKEIIEVDLEIMQDIAAIAEKQMPSIAAIKPVQIVQQFERSIKKELSFVNEAVNIERFAQNFNKDTNIHIPKIYRQLSTQRILTMEFIEGCKIDNVLEIEKFGANPAQIASLGVNLYFKQIFIHGFFHADPHPGNIFLLPNHKICFLDFGLVGKLSPSDRSLLGDFIIGIATQNPKQIVQAILNIANNPLINDLPAFESEIMEMVDEYAHQSLSEISGVINQIRKLIFKYQLSIPPNFYLLLKTLVMIEGMGMKLDPNFNIMKHLQPYSKKLFRQKMSPQNMAYEVLNLYQNTAYFTSKFPTDVKSIVQQLKGGKLSIPLEHKGIEPILQTFETIANRISIALVLSAFIIGASLLTLNNSAQLPFISKVGFGIAFILSLWLLFSIYKSKKY